MACPVTRFDPQSGAIPIVPLPLQRVHHGGAHRPSYPVKKTAVKTRPASSRPRRAPSVEEPLCWPAPRAAALPREPPRELRRVAHARSCYGLPFAAGPLPPHERLLYVAAATGRELVLWLRHELPPPLAPEPLEGRRYPALPAGRAKALAPEHVHDPRASADPPLPRVRRRRSEHLSASDLRGPAAQRARCAFAGGGGPVATCPPALLALRAAGADRRLGTSPAGGLTTCRLTPRVAGLVGRAIGLDFWPWREETPLPRVVGGFEFGCAPPSWAGGGSGGDHAL
eukprot:scaffold277806_cov27-Tisochrysis_lutea.AAC.2